MNLGSWLLIANMFLLPAQQESPNPWKEKLAPALQRAKRAPSPESLFAALDAAWRADDWNVGAKLADEAAEKYPNNARLRGASVRALWRARRIGQAEHHAAHIPAQTTDPIALTMLIQMCAARGDIKRAIEAADRLESVKPTAAAHWLTIVMLRVSNNRLDGLVGLIRKTQRLSDADNGYPENYVGEHLEGLADFYAAVGSRPINQVAQIGAAKMFSIPLIRLPGCDVFINGHGPFRMVLDTGGSIGLSIDSEIAEQIGLKSVAQAQVRGVSGVEDTGQAVVDELRIGEIVCKRVMTRIFGVRKATAFTADGIIGTGIFSDARMRLDFSAGRLEISNSSAKPGPGVELPLRIIGDSKLVLPIKLAGQPATALLDSGADVAAFSPARLKRLFPDRTIPTLAVPVLGVGQNQAPEIALTPGVDLDIAGRRYEDFGGLGLDILDTVLSPILGMQFDVLIGMPIFRDMKTCTVDLRRCKMWVEWAHEN